MLSFWENESLLDYDIIIIGSGLVGLSTAISIKEREPKKRILILERGILPTGASTKNAGFACIGSLTEILDDLKCMSESDLLKLVEMRHKGLLKLRARLGESNMEYKESGSHELIAEKEKKCLDETGRVNQLLKQVFNKDVFDIVDHKISDFGFSSAYARHLIQNSFEGELHSGKLMRSLIDLAMSYGVEIKTGCLVSDIQEETHKVRIIVKQLLQDEEIEFVAPQVVVCTNAFAGHLFPLLDVKPGRGHVLITEPVHGLKFKGIFHFDKGYYYFRELAGRVLFGGGRNLDFEGEATEKFAFNLAIRDDLILKLETLILPGLKFEIADAWTGIMAFGKDKLPLLKRQSDRIFLGVRMGGMGVAIGSEIGEQLATMVLDD